jgi:hypothetical protein
MKAWRSKFYVVEIFFGHVKVFDRRRMFAECDIRDEVLTHLLAHIHIAVKYDVGGTKIC